MKPKRVARSKEDLRQELVDQLGLLRSSCEAYDNGTEAAGKYIALTLRVLLHVTKNSRALLDQLGMRSGRFLSSAPSLNRKNLLSECNLVSIEIKNGESKYIPLVTIGGGPFSLQPVQFVSWWSEPVLKDRYGKFFSRSELVLNISNTDGGAHVDPELDEAYMALSRENSFGWVVDSGDKVSAISGRIELACMRQIAHELQSTLHRYHSGIRING